MSESSIPTRELMRKLAEERRKEQKEVGSLMSEELKQQLADFTDRLSADLATTRSDIRHRLRIGWMRSLLIGLMISLGISVGAWGMMQLLSLQVSEKITELSKIDEKIEIRKAVLSTGKIESDLKAKKIELNTELKKTKTYFKAEEDRLITELDELEAEKASLNTELIMLRDKIKYSLALPKEVSLYRSGGGGLYLAMGTIERKPSFKWDRDMNKWTVLLTTGTEY